MNREETDLQRFACHQAKVIQGTTTAAETAELLPMLRKEFAVFACNELQLYEIPIPVSNPEPPVCVGFVSPVSKKKKSE